MYKYLHDVHFHLDLYDNINEIINEIESCKIHTIAVTNLPALFNKLNNLVSSNYINVALGFHPELLFEYRKYIPEMWKFLKIPKHIGEVGLDFHNKVEKEKNIQISFLSELIDRCNALDSKILSVHSRSAEREVMLILGDGFNGKIILHWYTGTLGNLNTAIDNGYFFSINNAMLMNQKGIKIVQKIPIDRILLESDAPFVKINNKTYKPSDLNLMINKLAVIKNISLETLKIQLSKNYEQLTI